MVFIKIKNILININNLKQSTFTEINILKITNVPLLTNGNAHKITKISNEIASLNY